MLKESSKDGLKDVCGELEKAVQRSRDKTVGGWLRQRKERLQKDDKKTKREG